MAIVEIITLIYNLPLHMFVTPLDSRHCRFKVEINDSGPAVMILKCSPEHLWAGEKMTMKFFTTENILRLGKLIATKRSEWF